MRPSARTIFKVVLSVLLGLLSVPWLGNGCYLFICWFRIHVSSVYYVDYPYATAAIVCFGIGLFSLWATFHGVWRRSFYGILFAAPIFLVLVAAGYLPDASRCVAVDTQYLSDVCSRLYVRYENSRSFPATEAEFREAVGPAPASRYKQRGNQLPYEVVVVTNANGPRLTDVSQRPGVIYYCVSKDLQGFWVAMTRLQSDVATTAHIVSAPGLPKEFWMAHAPGHDYPIRKP